MNPIKTERFQNVSRLENKEADEPLIDILSEDGNNKVDRVVFSGKSPPPVHPSRPAALLNGGAVELVDCVHVRPSVRR